MKSPNGKIAFGFSVALIERRNTKSPALTATNGIQCFSILGCSTSPTHTFNLDFSYKTGMCFSTAALVEFGTNSSIGFPSQVNGAGCPATTSTTV